MYEDDEPVCADGGEDVPDIEGRESDPIKSGKISLTYITKDEAALGETDFDVLVKLQERADASHRAPLDLVAVLQASDNMNGEKLQKLKTAMAFVIRKLGPCDRLSVVIFYYYNNRLCPLRRMKGNAPAEIENLVNGLNIYTGTNILGGLYTAKSVLDGRKFKQGRRSAIMLLSDGRDNYSRRVNGLIPVQYYSLDVPVYAFGFGGDQDWRVLQDIAAKSRGGTYANVESWPFLTEHFSLCLSGLVTTAVQDLELTLKPELGKSEIIDVQAGNYPPSKNPADSSVTVRLGTLCCQRTCKVLVNLRLARVERKESSTILEIKYAHRDETADPIFVKIKHPADPLAPIYRALSNFNRAAIQSLNQNESILKEEVKTAQELQTLLENVDKAYQSIHQLEDVTIDFLLGHLKSNIKQQ